MRDSRRAATSMRVAALLVVVASWCWLWSVHTPWAADLEPRLWLYDLLYYARVLLVAWVLAECALWTWHPARRTGIGTACLATTLALSAGAWMYANTGFGWRLRVEASALDLDALAARGDGIGRQRAGLVLVDTLRVPCDAATPWFWLGRPHGAGSGTNLALVRSDTLPRAPFADAFRLRRIDGDWWMAYQDGAEYQALQGNTVASACGTPLEAASHRTGMAFIDAG